jgi:hypothetical protein
MVHGVRWEVAIKEEQSSGEWWPSGLAVSGDTLFVSDARSQDVRAYRPSSSASSTAKLLGQVHITSQTAHRTPRTAM